MRILYHHRTLADGAEGIHIREIVDALRDLGHEVKVICPRAARKETGLGPNHNKKSHSMGYIRLFFKQCAEILYNCVSYQRARLSIRRFKPEFIYERYTPLNFGGVLAARHTKTPLILEVNATYGGLLGCDIPSVFPRLLKWIEESVLRWANGIVVVSTPLKECITSRIGDSNKLIVLPNAINTNKIFGDGDSLSKRQIVRHRYNIKQDFVVGFVGSMRRWHGLDFLSECIPCILEKSPETHFLLVGSGEMESELREFVLANGLTEKVTITGAVSHEEVYLILNAVDVGVSPDTPPYASPMKILEYMAFGAVPVAPDYAPIREIITHRQTGLIFTPRSKHEFVEAIHGLSENPPLLKRLSEAAKAEVLRERTWTRNAEQILLLYDLVSKK